jgi:hypothetical protein
MKYSVFQIKKYFDILQRFKKHSRELQAVVEGRGPETHLTKMVRQAGTNFQIFLIFHA